jgi:hypothetical protein
LADGYRYLFDDADRRICFATSYAQNRTQIQAGNQTQIQFCDNKIPFETKDQKPTVTQRVPSNPGDDTGFTWFLPFARMA